MIESMHYTVSTIASALEQAQNQKLSHLLCPNNILKRIKEKIDAKALANGYISYVNKITDLFQILVVSLIKTPFECVKTYPLWPLDQSKKIFGPP